MNKPKFSVVLIARNESKTLPRLISSLKEFQERGGEICLLDTGSTDNTAQIARDLGCTVEEVGDKFRITIDEQLAQQINERFVVDGEEPVVKAGESMFDYANSRNHAAKMSSNDMIATPDCDEIWTAFDIDTINKHIENGAEQFVYNFVFAHDEEGKPLVQFSHSKFYNRKKLFWTNVIHEVLQGEAITVHLDESVAKLEHFQNVETNRGGYLKGLAYDCYLHQDSDRNSHYLAREMLYTGRYRSAIKEFERHIAMNKWQTERAQSMLFIGDCHYYLGNKDEAVKWYLKSFDLEPNRREPIMKLAEMAYRENKPVQVIAYCTAALELPGVNYYATHQPYYEHLPHELLYWAFWHSGNKEKSKEHYDKAVAFSPNNPKYISERHFYYPEEIKEGDLAFTGERVVVDKMQNRPDILREHLARYEFAAQFTEGLNVLDAACGTGYGSEILNANNYFGIDVSKEAIDYAKEKYQGYFNIEDLEKELEIPSVDVVVSFETIEHLENPHNFLDWVKDNSKAFVFSIPINMPSEFHKQVYSVEQIKELIGKYFKHCVFLGQDDDKIGILENPKYIVGVATNIELPSVSFIVPTLGREEGLKKCLDSIKELNYPQELIDVNVLDGEGTVPQKVARGVVETSGEFIVYAANDMTFDTNCILIAVVQSLLLGKRLVSFNEGELLEDKGNICTHFIIKRDLIPEIGGEVFDTRYKHLGVDNLLWSKCVKLNEAYHSETAKIDHRHFTKGAEFDDVYKKAWNEENIKHDRELLKQDLEKLNEN